MWNTPAVWKQYNKMAVLHFFSSKFLSIYSILYAPIPLVKLFDSQKICTICLNYPKGQIIITTLQSSKSGVEAKQKAHTFRISNSFLHIFSSVWRSYEAAHPSELSHLRKGFQTKTERWYSSHGSSWLYEGKPTVLRKINRIKVGRTFTNNSFFCGTSKFFCTYKTFWTKTELIQTSL